MYLLGHADAKLTMSVYQQVLDLGSDALGDLETVLGCSLQEAFRASLGGRFWHPVGTRAVFRPSKAGSCASLRTTNPALGAGFVASG